MNFRNIKKTIKLKNYNYICRKKIQQPIHSYSEYIKNKIKMFRTPLYEFIVFIINIKTWYYNEYNCIRYNMHRYLVPNNNIFFLIRQ